MERPRRCREIGRRFPRCGLLPRQRCERVFLIDSLVAQQPWAQQMIECRRAIAVSCIEQITSWVASPDRVCDVSDLLHVEPALP